MTCNARLPRVDPLVLDAGAFVAIEAVERDDRSMIARLQAAECDSIELRTSANVRGQVGRDPAGRQARPAHLLRADEVRPSTSAAAAK